MASLVHSILNVTPKEKSSGSDRGSAPAIRRRLGACQTAPRQVHPGWLERCPILLEPGASRPAIQSLLKRGVELLQHGNVSMSVDSHNLASTVFKRERFDYALAADRASGYALPCVPDFLWDDTRL